MNIFAGLSEDIISCVLLTQYQYFSFTIIDPPLLFCLPLLATSVIFTQINMSF